MRDTVPEGVDCEACVCVCVKTTGHIVLIPIEYSE